VILTVAAWLDHGGIRADPFILGRFPTVIFDMAVGEAQIEALVVAVGWQMSPVLVRQRLG